MTKRCNLFADRVARLLLLVAAFSFMVWLTGGQAGRSFATHAMPCSDVDGDGTVSKIDADIESTYYLQSVPPAPAAADMNASLNITVFDLATVASNNQLYTLCQDTPFSWSGGVPPASGSGAYGPDTDGDGCPDANEGGANPLAGGVRDYLNPWDYFNPTGDGRNRVDDILAVVQRFGLNAGMVGYSTIYDRSSIGPNPWNLGPPNGEIRVNDILAEVYQFRHDCP